MVKLPELREKKAKQRKAGAASLQVARPGIPPFPMQLSRPRTIIGRDKEHCDVVLEEESVSRQHASISKESSGFYVLHDLGSRNGVLCAGQKVERRTLLDGDVFVVGETTFTFKQAAPPAKK
jgi:pSer/pThr/pTyr-binding forkhead associated (FHA) protein